MLVRHPGQWSVSTGPYTFIIQVPYLNRITVKGSTLILIFTDQTNPKTPRIKRDPVSIT